MAKRKSKASDAQVRQLKAEIANLKLKAGGGKKKKKKDGNQNRPGEKRVTLRSEYARAVLDPFSVEGARVPDSFMLRTGTSFVRWLHNSSKPSFNFSNLESYVYLNLAPLWVAGGKPFWAAGVNPPSAGAAPSSWFNIGASNSWNTGTWLNPNATAMYDVDNPGKSSYRVTGGGLKIGLGNIREEFPVEVFLVPSFNGEPCYATFQDMVSIHTRSWTIKSPKDQIVIPFPVRNSSTAYTWVKDASRPGTETDDYPDEDAPFTAANLRTTMGTGINTDHSATAAAINAWSMQSGLGGIQVVMRIPPGAYWMAEGITHIEYIPQYSSVTGRGSGIDADYEVCLANSEEVEAVCNAAAATTQVVSQNEGGAETPWNDLQRLAREGSSQLVGAVTDSLADTQMLRRLVGTSLGVAANAYAHRQRRLLMRG